MDLKSAKTTISYNQFRDAINTQENILFKDNSFDFVVSFINNSKTTFTKSLSFTNCSFKGIEFQNVIFNGKVYFQSCHIEDKFTVNNCIFRIQAKFYHISCNFIAMWDNDFDKEFELYNFENVKDLTLQFNKVGKINIKQWHVDPIKLEKIHILFNGLCNSSIGISDLVSKKIDLNFSGQYHENGIGITDLKTDELIITNLKNKSNNKINILRVYARKANFIWWHNDGLLTLQEFGRYNEKEDSCFSLQECYLGNAELYNIDLRAFEKVQIYNCHLQNIIPVNVKWNFDLNAYKGTKTDYLRELFRQLKNVCSKNMDKIGQLQFEKMEMLFYSSELNWKKNFQDWFILKSNHLSNNHGLSWSRPLLWLLGISFILYTIINKTLGSFECYHIGHYLSFLIPLHNIKDILCLKTSETIQSNWVYFWDVIQKIISGYFIFQFLRAFRKFVN